MQKAIAQLVLTTGEKRINMCYQMKNYIPGPNILLPNKHTINVTSQGIIPLSDQLTGHANKTMILPGLKSASLISIGQLYDDNCDVLLNRTKLIAIKDKKLYYEGQETMLMDYGTSQSIDNLTSPNYKDTNIHPGMYPTRRAPKVNSVTFTPKKR